MNEQQTDQTVPAEDNVTQLSEAVTQQEAQAEPSNTVVIEVQNPTAEEMEELRAHVKANYDFDVTVKPRVFNFKKSVDKETGVETIRKPVELAIPYPSMEGILNIIEKGEKGLELLMEAMEDVVNNVARDMLNDLGGDKLNAATFPVGKLAWQVIAEMPKSARRGGGIPKEVWEAFAKNYVEVMVPATGKTIEQVANAAKILHNKLAQVKTNEPVLTLLVEQLAIYAEASPEIEEYQECIKFLLEKADTFLNVSDEELLANL